MRKRKAPPQSPLADKQALAQLFAAGRYADCERLARRMTAAYPGDAFGWKALGAALQETGRTVEALEPMQRAAELPPRDAEAYGNLGIVFDRLGRFEEAAAAYRRAIAINPSLAETHCNLGSVLRKLGRAKEGIAAYRTAIERRPEYPEAYNGLGNAFKELGRLNEAEAAYRTAIEYNPELPEAHNGLGNVLRDLAQLNEAESSCRRAIELRPGYPDAYNNLGNVLLELGRMEDAASAYRAAIAGDPELAESYRNLGVLAKYAGDDPRIPAMQQLYRERQLSASDHIHICFALGKACEDLERTDDAFAYYAEGNRLRKQQLGYSQDADRRLFAAIRAAYSQAVPPPPSFPADCEPRPIFIVGMPRSGTTLAEQILASHSKVFGAGELAAMQHALYGEFNPDGRGYRFNRDANAIARIRRDYRAALQRLAPGAPVVTDKMPANFRWIGFMLEAFPEARVVNLMRDPVAVCWSIYKLYFPASSLGFAYDFDDLAGYYGLYRELMAFWRERFPNRIYDLDYQRLTEHQEEQTRALLDYCGLDWEQGCLDFYRNQRAVRSASALQVRKKLYKGSSEDWKRFEKHLAPLVEALRAYR